MYLKGQSFVAACVLLRQADSSEHSDYVSLHLLCQGLELMLKGALLLKDFDAYWPKLKKLGHDLTRLVEETGDAYGQNALRGTEFRTQLKQLAQHFRDHALRYAGLLDIFIAPQSMRWNVVWRRTRAFIVLMEHGMKDSGIHTPSRVF